MTEQGKGLGRVVGSGDFGGDRTACGHLLRFTQQALTAFKVAAGDHGSSHVDSEGECGVAQMGDRIGLFGSDDRQHRIERRQHRTSQVGDHRRDHKVGAASTTRIGLELAIGQRSAHALERINEGVDVGVHVSPARCNTLCNARWTLAGWLPTGLVRRRPQLVDAITAMKSRSVRKASKSWSAANWPGLLPSSSDRLAHCNTPSRSPATAKWQARL